VLLVAGCDSVDMAVCSCVERAPQPLHSTIAMAVASRDVSDLQAS
jgi:hypothetical protein